MTGRLFVFVFVRQRESVVRLVAVSKKNAAGSESKPDESVSLVLVSAKGRVAAYDESLKLLASFTLGLSCAPAGDARPAPGEEPPTSAGQPVGGPTPATKSLHKGTVAQKVRRAFLRASFLASDGRCTRKR